MRLLSLLFRYSRLTVVAIVACGLASGAINSALVAAISQALEEHRLPLVAYIGLALGVGVANLVPSLLMSRLSRTAVADLRTELAKKIARVPLRKLEEIGNGRILAAFAQDVPTIAGGATALPGIFIGLSIAVGCIAYLAWLSPSGMLFTVPGIFLMGLFYYLRLRMERPHFERHREAEDRIFREQDQLLLGAKELRLNAERRREFLRDAFSAAVLDAKRLGIRADMHNASWMHAGFTIDWLVLIGILFCLPLLATNGAPHARSYIVITLYFAGVIHNVLGTSLSLLAAHISLKKLDDLDLSIDRGNNPEVEHAPGEVEPRVQQEVSLVDASYTLTDPGRDRAFRLGPINLTFRTGELVFVIGGNGSGKTTFAKLLTGLYAPSDGAVEWNHTKVTDATRDAYRNQFSTVFFDFHVFDKLHGVSEDDKANRVRQYLKEFDLDKIVTFDEVQFNTTKLSTGQKKRLAAVVALLDDRPFFLFDEWAADQDPEFKEVFYKHLLPDLVARGKGVIAITHDDRYFHLANRVIKLRDGVLVQDP